eukprot:3301812-Amphidinium_carterae.1
MPTLVSTDCIYCLGVQVRWGKLGQTWGKMGKTARLKGTHHTTSITFREYLATGISGKIRQSPGDGNFKFNWAKK